MRALIISIVIILIITAISIFNALWTASRVEELLETVNDIDINDSDELTYIIKEWERARSVFTFTVHRIYLREIDDALQRASVAAQREDEFEFESARRSIIYKMKELCDTQCFGWKTVL